MLVPKVIHGSPTEGIFLRLPPSHPTSLEIPVKKASYIYLNFWIFTPQEFPIPSVACISSNYFESLLLPQWHLNWLVVNAAQLLLPQRRLNWPVVIAAQ